MASLVDYSCNHVWEISGTVSCKLFSSDHDIAMDCSICGNGASAGMGRFITTSDEDDIARYGLCKFCVFTRWPKL